MSQYGLQQISTLIANISSHLGSTEIREGSFLYRLSEVIVSESDSSLMKTNKIANNIHLETCDESSLELFGNDLGVQRIRVPKFTILSGEQLAFFETPNGSLFPSFLNGVVVLAKGQKITRGDLTITANEDFVISSGVERVYVSCTISSTSSITLGSSTNISILTNENYLKNVVFRLTQEVTFTTITESTSSFRNRLLLDKKANGSVTEEYILNNITGISGIATANIIDDTIVFSTNEMQDFGDSSSAESYKRIIISELTRVVPWPKSYNVKVKDRADLRLDYKRMNTSNISILDLETAIVELAKTLINTYGAIDKKRLEMMVKTSTEETISISDMYILDFLTGAEIDDFSEIKDIYIYVSLSNFRAL